MKTGGVEPDYYNPAKDDAKLQAAMVDPLPFDGWPSRWKRCVAAEVLELRAALTAAQQESANYLAEWQLALKQRDKAQQSLTASEKRSFVEARISYRRFSYGVGSQWGIDSLRDAINRNGDA